MPVSISSRPREVTLAEAINAIESSVQRNRLSALDDLVFLFGKRAKLDEPPRLKDKDYHRILDALFRCALSEKQTYLSGKKSSGTSKQRLQKCAEALRIVVEHGVAKMRAKTLEAVIDHITQTLPGPDEDFVEPLLADYIKTLAALIGYAPSLEILAMKGSEGWLTCVDFVLQVIEQLLDDAAAGDSTPSRSSPAPGTPQTFSLGASTLRSTASSTVQRVASGKVHGRMHDLLECLFLLVSAANAPILKRSRAITGTVLQCLDRVSGLSPMLQYGFSILNLVLSAAQTEDIEQTCSLVSNVLPLITKWWQAKTTSQENALLNGIQAEMLKMLLTTHLNIDYLVRQRDLSHTAAVEDLCDMFWDEYSRRDDRAKLRLEDLTFSSIPQHPHAFQTPYFCVKPHSLESERRWAVVHVLAILEAILWNQAQTPAVLHEKPEEHPRKKRRGVATGHRLRQKLLSQDVRVQHTALQVMPFFVLTAFVPATEIAEMLSLISPWLSHKNTKLSVWAMISGASFAGLALASGAAMASSWKLFWQMATRNISLPGTSRASCVLMNSIISHDLVSYHDVSTDLNNIITAADISGPAIVVDASVMLMTTLLTLRNYRLPSASYATCGHVVRWLFLRWDPADPNFAISSASHVQPFDIINLLRAACSLSDLTMSNDPLLINGSIGQAWSQIVERRDILQYLLLLDDPVKPPNGSRFQKPSSSYRSFESAESANTGATKKLVAELLFSKIEELQSLCDGWAKRGEGNLQISAEKLRSLLGCLLVATFSLPHLYGVDTKQSQGLDVATFKLLRDSLGVALDSADSQTLYEVTLQSIRPYLPDLRADPLSYMLKEVPQLFELCSELSSICRSRDAQKSSTARGNPMDIDDEFDSQESHISNVSKTLDVPRREPTPLDLNSLYLDVVQRLHFLKVLHDDPGQVGLVPESFLQEYLRLSDEAFLSCRFLSRELFASDLVMSPDAAVRVVDRVAAVYGTHTYLSSQVALHTCLDIIDGFLPLWTNEGNELSIAVGDIYQYLIERALPENHLSTELQCRLARLLFRLTEINERFPETVNLPTSITTLLSILQKSSIRVQFHIATDLPRIFSRFILKTHDQVCMDIIDSLPKDPNASEGIALRLFVLSQLGRSWSTVLRRCVYHIFEAPGIIRDSTKHATFCLRSMSHTLGLANSQKLFDLFAPQILYTWLEQDSIKTIPFEIFGYSSLSQLLQQSQSEAAALMIMRGQETEFETLASLLDITPTQLLHRSFSKIMAYTIAHDISMSKSESPNEARIRKMLGREPYHQNIYVGFADIIGLFFTLIDQEDPVERSWAKDVQFTPAADAMAAIKKCGCSDVELAVNQQPQFRSKYLVRELNLICSRTEYELPHLWTPALVVSVARRLFNMIHPALGPLHTCSVLRKVRVLICLAGSEALSSYPLEMLLHAIRPYLVDPECAEDSLGISQYLLTHGAIALSQSPSFLAGYALATLASLRVFLESSQASTTQESQFKATMNKAQQFHTWFSKYLENYQSPRLRRDDQVAAFRTITQSAAHVRSSGNAERGSHESNLLLEILRDEGNTWQLLNKPSRESALRILCRDFRVPTSFHNDAINSDSEAVQLSSAVWKSVRSQPQDSDYLIWAGRVIGRAFATSGEINPDIVRESKLSQYLQHKPSSEKGLLMLLQALSSHHDCSTAGLAEAALRSIVSESAADEDKSLIGICQDVLNEQLFASSNWNSYRTPPSDECQTDPIPADTCYSADSLEERGWARRLTIHLTQSVSNDPILRPLPQLLAQVEGFAEDAFPFIVHLVLSVEILKARSVKRNLSAALKDWLKSDTAESRDNLRILINAVLYLRSQKFPKELNIIERTQWLDVDLTSAAHAAARCGMYKTALLFIESATTEGSRSSRRSSTLRTQDSTDVLLDIFENIDDPDAHHGLRSNTSLSDVLARLEYEKEGNKSLAFRGAQYDSHIRLRNPTNESDHASLVTTLSSLGLAGLSHSLLQGQQNHEGVSASIDVTFNNARRLEIWNLPVPSTTSSPSVTLYKAFQGCSQASKSEDVQKAIFNGFKQTMQNLIMADANTTSIRQGLCALTSLTDLDDVLHASSLAELDGVLLNYETRSEWMRSGRYDDVSQILSTRETSLSMLGQTLPKLAQSNVPLPDASLARIKSMLVSSKIYRFHQANQECLNIATTLNDMIEPSLDLGLTIDVAARLEAANALWDHDEMIPSIRILQRIDFGSDLRKQTVLLNRSDLLTKIAYQVSVARLEKPDDIQQLYLQPALRDLKGKTDGREAGKVYHQYARFCDEQLQSSDSLEDLARLQHLRQGKSDEVVQLQALIKSSKDSQVRSRYSNHLAKAKQWLDLDEQELRRVEQSRSEFGRLSLENYLLSLSASDENNDDALRFTALWLERSTDDIINEAVRKNIEKVPTRKFAPLMNQLTSRLLDQSNLFQKLLIDLIYRICVDHPYHGMYQIWSGTKSRTNNKDDVAVLRQKATQRVSRKLAQTESAATIWQAIDKTSKAYHGLAVEKDNARYKAGAKMAVKDSASGSVLINTLSQHRIPPPTTQIELSASRDYSHIPHVIKLEPSMTIASGVSAPKIITLVGSNGERFKQLVKGGSDDLRQDAIMEQVFAAVSSVLKRHRSTQQRDLGIRTYKVLPLTASSGLIEFVPNTIPLHEYLMPAHERYNPRDLKGSTCRKEISQVQSKSVETRLSTYKKVIERFHPVMRYFFMEYFTDPDEWYAKRTAYTRTTAAISILGHVLGLGDRHGHNILLDSATGEVVHIDLGVAFEMGRVLPVPELVPFRLTRDIVDGMGVTKTEGVFRRCCEATLDALREETYSIMTILDVLRYDPLYSWSISPVRMAKLQDTRRDDDVGEDGPGESELDLKKKRGLVNEPSEADRALEVVRKKLSKTLSVTATVNDLINQAMDERNLAVLYSGWAAYA